MNNHNTNHQSIYKDEITLILEKIAGLQRRAVREELEDKFCDHDFLGDEECCFEECNTRPIQVFTHEDKAWYCPVDRDEDGCLQAESENTCVFRVEKVENGVVVLRALKEKERHHEEGRREEVDHRKGRHEKFKSTNSFITIKIEKIAAIRCFKDTFVNLCLR